MQASTEILPTGLTGPQLQVVQALLSGHTVTSAAHACGIPERTIRGWKQDPAFRTALLQGQSHLLEETCTLLSVAAAEAIKALVEVCQDPLASPGARVVAAGKLLTLLFHHVPQTCPLPAPPATSPAGTTAAQPPALPPDTTPTVSEVSASEPLPSRSATPSSAAPSSPSMVHSPIADEAGEAGDGVSSSSVSPSLSPEVSRSIPLANGGLQSQPHASTFTPSHVEARPGGRPPSELADLRHPLLRELREEPLDDQEEDGQDDAEPGDFVPCGTPHGSPAAGRVGTRSPAKSRRKTAKSGRRCR